VREILTHNLLRYRSWCEAS